MGRRSPVPFVLALLWSCPAVAHAQRSVAPSECAPPLLPWEGRCATEAEVARDLLPPVDLAPLPRRGPNVALVAIGAVLVLSSYATALGIGVALAPLPEAGFAAIPYVHALAGIETASEGLGGSDGNRLVVVSVGIGAGVLELVGTILLAVAHLDASPALGPMVHLEPGPAGSEIGLGVALAL